MKRVPIAVCLAGLTLVACTTAPGYDEPWAAPTNPVPLATQLAFVDQAQSRVWLLDPGARDLKPRRVDVALDPARAARRNGHDELLVLSRGRRGDPGVEPVDAELAIIPADRAGPTQRLKLASRFDDLAQSDGGRFVLLHSTGGARADVLFNPNEIAIVDLEANPPSIEPRTLRSFGGVPEAVVFSPSLSLPDGPRTLAVILSANYVTLLDLQHPDRPEITVPLTLADDRRVVRPVQVLFDAQDPTVYVRATGANDIYALRLVAVPPAERTSHDFRPALSQLAAGTQPADMALFDGQEGRRLLVVSPSSKDAFVIDARTNRSTRLALEFPANRVLLFAAPAPGDARVATRALLVPEGMGQAGLTFLDLTGLEELRTRNLDSRAMPAPVVDAVLLGDRGLALVRHGTQGNAPSGFSMVDLGGRTVAPIRATAAVDRLAVGHQDRVWIGSGGSDWVGFLELPSLRVGEVRLDAPVGGLFVFPAAADRPARLVVTHPDPVGHVTVLDAVQPDRTTARTARGFLLTDLFDRGDR